MRMNAAVAAGSCRLRPQSVWFLSVAVFTRISSVVPEPVKRAKHGTFGDADWLPMGAAARLFPDDGEIVVGERYRVDKELVHALPFDPNDPTTWGKGGTAPLLTYKQDFDSTHMLFFAGSGGYKTTSNVVPTALRYTGPIICLDPSTEVAPMVVEHRRKRLRREVMVLDLGMLHLAGAGVALHAKPAVAAEAQMRIDHGDLTALLYIQGYRKTDFVIP